MVCEKASNHRKTTFLPSTSALHVSPLSSSSLSASFSLAGSQGQLGYYTNQSKERHKQWVKLVMWLHSILWGRLSFLNREHWSINKWILCFTVLCLFFFVFFLRSLPCLCWRSKSWNHHRWHKSSFCSIWKNIVSMFLWYLVSGNLWAENSTIENVLVTSASVSPSLTSTGLWNELIDMV